MAKFFGKSRRKTDPRRDGRLGKSDPKSAAPLPLTGVYAFMGATGGVGTTSAACAMAVDLARRVTAARPGLAGLSVNTHEPCVALIDLDFEAGACAHHLDLLPTLSATDLARPSNQMDSTFVSSMIDQSVEGVALISAANGEAGAPNPRTVLALLDAVTQIFDYVVIDVPRTLQPWTLPVLAGADAAMIMAELTVPSLHMARLRRSQLGPALQGTGRSLLPVIGKLERRSGRGALQLSDAETALGEPAFGSLPFDPDPLRAVINSGEALAVARPDCRYMRDLRSLTDKTFAMIAENQGIIAVQSDDENSQSTLNPVPEMMAGNAA
jgi:pilus assembly protein CpaE